ncbi:hypothetical protein [Rubrolithibacter danxiaensis]|uniref:hypothetical protein n=1 Tax=Rubrolithibacter danxiaensis TaxID=3390805 RepID=UPI003BF7DB15
MNTKYLMSGSAVILGITGIALSFFPQEIAENLGAGAASSIIFQLLGAVYFGFAMLNWMAKANLIGGIYSRPVAIGNMSHFTIGALALIKIPFNGTGLNYVWVGALVYSVLAILFGYVLFTNPAYEAQKEQVR